MYRFPKLIFAASLAASLSGCFTPHPKSQTAIVPFPEDGAPAVQDQATSTSYTLDTPIERIAADPDGAAVLNKDIPGLLTNPNYGMIKSMNLKTVASLSGGRLDGQTLAQTKTDLAALPKQASLK